MKIQTKIDVLLDALSIEDIDLETAEQIINLASETARDAGRIAAVLFNEAVTLQKGLDLILELIASSDCSDSRKLKTITRIITAMPGVMENREDRFKRIFENRGNDDGQ